MKTTIIAIALFLTAVPSFAFTTVCGVRLPTDALIKLSIEMTQRDPFSPATVSTIDGKKPGMITKDGAARFGYKGYESISLKLNKCEGTALYNHYNSTHPMNPMEKLSLTCVCP